MGRGESPSPFFMYFVYIVRCADTSLYIGTAAVLHKRIHAHNHLKSGARYTRSRRPVRLVKYLICDSKSQALKLEAKLKKLNKKQKEIFISNEI